jgi:hypothetical protein
MYEKTFIISFGDEVLGKTNNWKDAYNYVLEGFGEKAININNFETFCQGKLNTWTYFSNPVIRIIDISKVNVLELIKETISEEEKENKTPRRIPKPVKPDKNTVTTPTRTRLITGKKTPLVDASKLPEGTKRKGLDGFKYIVKNKNGKNKWVKHSVATHSIPTNSNRKSPASKAKEYKDGTVMKGEDGNMWEVKKINSNTYKWIKRK